MDNHTDLENSPSLLANPWVIWPTVAAGIAWFAVLVYIAWGFA